jgi:hypothetical protein
VSANMAHTTSVLFNITTKYDRVGLSFLRSAVGMHRGRSSVTYSIYVTLELQKKRSHTGAWERAIEDVGQVLGTGSNRGGVGFALFEFACRGKGCG